MGRERELAEALRLLEKHRLRTLGGPGGIGETRLATAAAAAAGGRFPDGVRIVEPASLSDPRSVARAVGAALGVPERSTSRSAAIVAALRKEEALLILDNCEHVVAPIADLASEILRGCAAVRVIATSREPLGVPGEAFWPVPPLTLPEPARSRVVDIAQSEAVRLFVERASLRVPAFDLTADNARAVAAGRRGLDGVPLAVELAAARLNALSVDEANARLAGRLRELRTDDAAVTPRHRALRSVVEWSHQACGTSPRRCRTSATGSVSAARSARRGPRTWRRSRCGRAIPLTGGTAASADRNVGTGKRVSVTRRTKRTRRSTSYRAASPGDRRPLARH